jgi:phosphoribosylformylglycinamidine synthase
VVVLGESRGELGGSEYLNVVHGMIRGVPPALDLTREAALQRLLVDGIALGLIRSAHDCAEGGLAITIAECCFDSGYGVDANLSAVNVESVAFVDTATLFGESPSRVVVSLDAARVGELTALASAAGIAAVEVGRTGGDRIRLSVDRRPVIDEPLSDAQRIWSHTIESFFERPAAKKYGTADVARVEKAVH